MVGGETGVDELVLHGLGIEHRDVAIGTIHWHQFCGRMVRTFFAEVRIVGAAHHRCHPHAALLVEHGVVVIRLGVPDFFAAPVRRGLQWIVARGVAWAERERGVGVAHRHDEIGDRVCARIEDWHGIGAVFGRAE